MIDSSTGSELDTRHAIWIDIFCFCTVSDSERWIFLLFDMHYESAGPFSPPSLLGPINFYQYGRFWTSSISKDRSLTAPLGGYFMVDTFGVAYTFLTSVVLPDQLVGNFGSVHCLSYVSGRLIPPWYQIPAGRWGRQRHSIIKQYPHLDMR